ncbi:hypothetical protein SAMN04487968_104277 [Nocardioides terrae]|uniref:Maltokinase N-terminal cap domain-containing protein n=1 Tax=Nocardioides terrae TaxID=574651 RepID=A0A1I1HD79_9ACTN|nr:hypothetical protein [Nocardioides terrae]SFC21801.1 hypothetical protein SAMN04487968_104277 [Nocardioides terrae]
MAVIHVDSDISPTKPELVAAWLPTQPWAAGLGELEQIGGYRFDDPDGEVGIEALLFRAGEQVLHLPLTYRGAPLEGADEFLICTMSHTALGDRWIYDGIGDRVAVDAYVTAILTGGRQADLEVERDGRIVGVREAAVQASGSGRASAVPDHAALAVTSRGALAIVESADLTLNIARLLPADVDGPETLTVVWDGGRAVAASAG